MGDQPQKLNFSSVQSLSCVQPFVTSWTAVHHASLSITNSWSLLKLMSIESAMRSNHLILCCPLLLLPSIIPSIRVFSNELVFHIRLPKYWSFSFNISPSNEYSGLISYTIDWFDSSFLKLKWLKNVKITSSGYMKRGESKPWCAPQPSKGVESLYPLQHRGPLKTWCSVREASHKRPHVVKRHWYKVSRIGKSRETEHSSVVA